MLIFSGMTMMQRYPLTAAARASPIPENMDRTFQSQLSESSSFWEESADSPVFPDVGSMMVSPGFRIPARSASSTMRRLILSFTLPPALKNSHLATSNQTTRVFQLDRRGLTGRGRGREPKTRSEPVPSDSHSSHLSPKALGMWLMRTMGVSPILCRMFGRMVGGSVLAGKKRFIKG